MTEKSPAGDLSLKVRYPLSSMIAALGAKLREFVPLIVIWAVPPLFVIPATVKFPTTVTVEVPTVALSPRTVELFPPIVFQVTVAFVPAVLEVQMEVESAFQVALVPLTQPNPAVAPLLSMKYVCALEVSKAKKHATRSGKTELRDFERQSRNGEKGGSIGND